MEYAKFLCSKNVRHFFWHSSLTSWSFQPLQPHRYTVPQMLCNGNGAISILQIEMEFLRTSVTACTIDKNIFSAPFGIFYVRTEIWKETFQEKSYTTPQSGTPYFQTTISKWGLQSTLGLICSFSYSPLKYEVIQYEFQKLTIHSVVV